MKDGYYTFVYISIFRAIKLGFFYDNNNNAQGFPMNGHRYMLDLLSDDASERS